MEEGGVQDLPHESRLVCHCKLSDPGRRKPLSCLLVECLPLSIGHIVSAYQGGPHGFHVAVREEGPWGARVVLPLSRYPCVLYLQLLGLSLCLPALPVKGVDLSRGAHDGVRIGLHHLVDPGGRSAVAVAGQVQELASVGLPYPLECIQMVSEQV